MGRDADVLLSDGATVHLRQIEPSDADAIVALHSRFSERTRYLRYFSPYPRIPERDLQRFVNVDHRDREALVVALGDKLIAVGRYERLGPNHPDAEAAFVVEDAYQGRGIGSVLLEHLAAAARDAGISRFVAEVLPANGAMLRVFADAGYQVEREYEDGVVHLTFPIQPTERSLAVQWSREHRSEARSVAHLLTPRGVAVYGASRSGVGVGAALLAHLRDGGFTGPVVPIHPTAETVGGLPARKLLTGFGQPVDLAVVAVPPAAVPDVVADCAAAGVYGLVVVSGGFAESGPEGAAAQEDLVRLAHASGMRVVGPNCLGVANTDPAVRLNATLAPRLPGPGRVGFFSQSGALGIALLAEAEERGLGLSTFVSAGNRADVSGNDLLQYWEEDPSTDVVLLYLETFGNPRKFARLARRLGRRKPIVAVAAPVRPPALATTAPGPDSAAVTALFARSGVIRVDTVSELFDVGVLLAHQPLPGGNRVAVVTNSAALGVLAVGACPAAGLTVAPGYPDDLGPEVPAERLAGALSAALADPSADALVVVWAPGLPGTAGDDAALEVIAEAAGNGSKPMVVTYLAGPVPPGVAAYPSVEEAVRALGRVAGYARWRREPQGGVPDLPGIDATAATEVLARGGPVADLLAAYGIRVVTARHAHGPEQAAAVAGELGYPVAVKVADPRLRHRIDLGAVRLDLDDADAVRRATEDIGRMFGAGTEVIVQPMAAPGVSCAVEVVEDPAFGPVVGFGLGGVTGELIGDRAWRAAPLTDRDAEGLVREPRGAALLFGYRGAAPVDERALTDLLLRVGRLADEHPEVRRLVLDPVLARADGYSVLHAQAVLGGPSARPDTGPRRL
ncbi:MAG TPA: GNAT family N-acetyltransferase [Micromonosporaceae bacterium]